MFQHITWDNYNRPGISILHKDVLEAYRLLSSAQKLGLFSMCQCVDCNSRHMLCAKGSVHVTSITSTLGTGPINSLFTLPQVCQSEGPCRPKKEKHAFSGHSHVLHPGPHPHTGSTTKALKSLFGFKDELWSPLLPNHSADLMASTQAIKII